MSATQSTMPQPPGAQPPDQGAPPSTDGASPAPATPAPGAQQSTQIVISIVSNLRALAKMYPAAAPKISEVNDKMREIMALTMQHQQPGEPQAPPNG